MDAILLVEFWKQSLPNAHERHTSGQEGDSWEFEQRYESPRDRTGDGAPPIRHPDCSLAGGFREENR